MSSISAIHERLDISNINKADLLIALYDASSPVGLGALAPGAQKPLSYLQAKREVAQRKKGDPTIRVDVLRGRPIKSSLGGDQLHPWLFDRENGYEAAKGAVIKLRLAALRPKSRAETTWRQVVDFVYKT